MIKCKRLVAILLSIIAIIRGVGSSFVTYAMDDETLIDEALGEYFLQREEEFFGGDIATQMNKNLEAADRSEFIQAWKEELDIYIDNVEIEYNIRNVILDTESELKLLVYEWVWIDYICNGYDVVDVMGFGTNHILEFTKENGALYLLDDAYIEITGYEAGTKEDLSVLRNKYETSEETNDLDVINLSGEDMLVVASNSYNGTSAVNYSNTWCGNKSAGTSVSMSPSNYNPSYYYYPGADCCNFVSQCLVAGGMTMDGIWSATLNTSGTVTSDSAYAKSGEAWRYVPTFQTYWKDTGYTVARITNSKQAVAGNPIYYLKSDGYSGNHIMLIVGKNAAGQVLINGHNNDAYRYPLTLSAKTYYTLDLLHSYSEVVSYNSSTHTMGCSNCGVQKTSPHTFVSIASTDATQICGICGYTK